MKVCVFGSSSKNTPEKYLNASRELGELLAKGGHTCVTGGGLYGCMGAVNDAAIEAKGNTLGVIHKMWCGQGVMDEKHKRLTKLVVVDGDNLLLEVACERGLGMHPRPVALVNIDGYYDNLLMQLKRAKEDKLLYHPPEKMIFVAKSAAEALAYCTKYYKKGAMEHCKTDEDFNEKTSTLPIPTETVVAAAMRARAMSMRLQALSSLERKKILECVADALWAKREDILKVNREDIEAAKSMQMSNSMRKRLVLDQKKLSNLCQGIRQIAASEDPIGKVIGSLEVSKGLILQQKTVPIGVLLIIFESRPDCLPQIASLAIKSGNGLLLKGGKEAKRSCRYLHSLIVEAVEKASNGRITKGIVGLVETRQDVARMLSLDNVIDLVIPRGSYSLVNFIKRNTKIPVLGHADGICHVFVDATCDILMAIRIIIDAKLQYSAACNSMETLLIHESLAESQRAVNLLKELQKKGIDLYCSDKALKAFKGKVNNLIPMDKNAGFSIEYGDHRLTVHITKDVTSAMEHINTYGSGHTDAIVTSDKKNAESFLRGVASACVFHNASTRFADGFRFGLGAEVGISTGKIHARGPVGVKGLTTTQWTLASTEKEGHTVADFADGKKTYTHKRLDAV
ncbi:hypothetical protein AAMO2058_001486900 [Amorphochlora amoebiformis]